MAYQGGTSMKTKRRDRFTWDDGNLQEVPSGEDVKAMSAFNESTGGALVKPPAVAKKVRKKIERTDWHSLLKIKSQGGPCQPGETAAQTGCTPASGEGGNKPGKPKTTAATKPTAQSQAEFGKPGVDGKFANLNSASYWQSIVYEGGPEYKPEEIEAFGDYSGFAYKQVNGLLRGSWSDENDPDFEQQTEELVKKLDAAIATRKLPERVVAFRGIRGLDLQPGDQFFDNGFASTSLDRHIAQEFADKDPQQAGSILEVEIPAGTPVGLVSVATGGTEMELLLPRGGRFEVTGREGNALQVKWLGAKP